MYNLVLNEQEVAMIRRAIINAKHDTRENPESRVRWQTLYDEIVNQMVDQEPEE